MGRLQHARALVGGVAHLAVNRTSVLVHPHTTITRDQAKQVLQQLRYAHQRTRSTRARSSHQYPRALRHICTPFAPPSLRVVVRYDPSSPLPTKRPPHHSRPPAKAWAFWVWWCSIACIHSGKVCVAVGCSSGLVSGTRALLLFIICCWVSRVHRVGIPKAHQTRAVAKRLARTFHVRSASPGSSG